MTVDENLPLGETHLPSSNDILNIQNEKIKFKDNCIYYDEYKVKKSKLSKENECTHRWCVRNARP